MIATVAANTGFGRGCLTIVVLGCLIGSGHAGQNRAPAPATPAQPVKSSFAQAVISDDERKLLADAKHGRFATIPFAEAALIASGVTEPAQRRRYLERLAALETQASAAVGNTASPLERGERLLAWLYSGAGPLASVAPRKRPKYKPSQTSLAVLLDSGSYNCVSATVIYNLIGRRLGLNLRAIEVPTHVFSILDLGDQRVDVETTTPRGFNPVRDKQALQEFQEMTGFVYIPARQRKKQRDIDEAALIGAIFYNRGVDAFRSKRHGEAFRYSVLAQRLDPLLAGASGNANAALSRWAGEAAAAGDIDLALEIVDRHVPALADRGTETKMILIAYQYRAAQASKARDWASVADIYVSGWRRHAKDERLAGTLQRNALAAYDNWAQPLKKAGRWAEAIAVYQGALKTLPDNRHLLDQLKFCQQRQRTSP